MKHHPPKRQGGVGGRPPWLVQRRTSIPTYRSSSSSSNYSSSSISNSSISKKEEKKSLKFEKVKTSDKFYDFSLNLTSFKGDNIGDALKKGSERHKYINGLLFAELTILNPLKEYEISKKYELHDYVDTRYRMEKLDLNVNADDPWLYIIDSLPTFRILSPMKQKVIQILKKMPNSASVENAPIPYGKIGLEFIASSKDRKFNKITLEFDNKIFSSVKKNSNKKIEYFSGGKRFYRDVEHCHYLELEIGKEQCNPQYKIGDFESSKPKRRHAKISAYIE